MIQQTQNSFSDGLNTDINPMMTPQTVLTDCLNGATISYNGNEFILQKELGNSMLFKIGDPDCSFEQIKVLAAKEYSGQLYIAADVALNGDSCLTVFSYPFKNEKTGDFECRVIPSLADKRLDLSMDSCEMELQPSYDNSVNIVLSDGVDRLYMVNSGFCMKPEGGIEINSKRFAKDDLDKLSMIRPVSTCAKVRFKGTPSGGSLPVGSYTFFFRYTDEEDNRTNIIAETRPISVFIGSVGKGIGSIRGGVKNENSSKSVMLSLSNLDPTYKYLKIYFARTTSDTNEVAITDVKELIEKYSITDSDNVEITITGNEASIDSTIEDINDLKQQLYSARTITQANNRLFGANVILESIDSDILKEQAKNITLIPKIGNDIGSSNTASNVVFNFIAIKNDEELLTAFTRIKQDHEAKTYSKGIKYVLIYEEGKRTINYEIIKDFMGLRFDGMFDFNGHKMIVPIELKPRIATDFCVFNGCVGATIENLHLCITVNTIYNMRETDLLGNLCFVRDHENCSFSNIKCEIAFKLKDSSSDRSFIKGLPSVFMFYNNNQLSVDPESLLPYDFQTYKRYFIGKTLREYSFRTGDYNIGSDILNDNSSNKMTINGYYSMFDPNNGKGDYFYDRSEGGSYLIFTDNSGKTIKEIPLNVNFSIPGGCDNRGSFLLSDIQIPQGAKKISFVAINKFKDGRRKEIDLHFTARLEFSKKSVMHNKYYNCQFLLKSNDVIFVKDDDYDNSSMLCGMSYNKTKEHKWDEFFSCDSFVDFFYSSPLAHEIESSSTMYDNFKKITVNHFSVKDTVFSKNLTYCFNFTKVKSRGATGTLVEYISDIMQDVTANHGCYKILTLRARPEEVQSHVQKQTPEFVYDNSDILLQNVASLADAKKEWVKDSDYPLRPNFIFTNYSDVPDEEANKNAYYSGINLYNSLGYWNDYYRFGVIFFNKYGTSTVYDITGNIANPDGSYNTDGVFRINKAPVLSISETKPVGLRMEVSVDAEKLKNIGIIGYQIVRQKRIPSVITQGLVLPKSKSGIPLIPSTGGKFLAESIIRQGKLELNTSDDPSWVLVDEKLIDYTGCILSPDHILNSEVLSQIVSGGKFDIYLSKNNNKNRHLSLLTNNSRHYAITDIEELEDQVVDASKTNDFIQAIDEGVSLAMVGATKCRTVAGTKNELHEYENVAEKPETYAASDFIRGEYTPYIGCAASNISNSLVGRLVDIKYSDVNDIDSILIRKQDNSAYFPISERIGIDEYLDDKILYGGDCFIGMFTVRLNKNFLGNTTPFQSAIIKPAIKLAEGAKPSNNGYGKSDDLKDNNIADFNAVRLGSWISFVCCSNVNHLLRCPDYSNSYEAALFSQTNDAGKSYGGHRSFYPNRTISTDPYNKLLDSGAMNSGYNKTDVPKYYFSLRDLIYQKDSFSTRIVYSNAHASDKFENSFRIFGNLSFKDYNINYGDIEAISDFMGNLFVFFKNGIGVAPIQERVVSGGGVGGEVYINTNNVLPERLTMIAETVGLSDKKGLVKTSLGLYGIDAKQKKIYRVNQKGIELISDFKIQKLLNSIDNIDNIKSFYNVYKNEVFFNIYGSEKSISISFSELSSTWVSRHSWYPEEAVTYRGKLLTFSKNRTVEAPDVYAWIHDIVPSDTLKHCNFFGSQEVFSFEFVVNAENPSVQKMFYNMKIVSNKEMPSHFTYELTDDAYRNINGDKSKDIQFTQIVKDTMKVGILKGNAMYKENALDVIITPLVDSTGRQSRIRDKYLKIKITYNGSDPVFIRSILTMYSNSYA